MKTVIFAIAAVFALSAPALASDLISASSTLTLAGIDPAVDQGHTVNLTVFTDAAGTPGASILVDGASPLP